MKIRISLFIYFFALACFALGYINQFLSYFLATLLHELAHAAFAKRLGYTLNELRLMPYGAALIGEFESAPARDEIKIAVVGPLLNLSLALLCVALWYFFPVAAKLTVHFAAANACLFAINLLPVYPLDGGRITLALSSRKTPRSVAYRRLRLVGYFVGSAMAVLFVVSCFFGANLSLMSMSAFVLLSTAFPDNRCYYQSLYRVAYRAARVKRGLEVRRVLVFASAPVHTLYKHLSPSYYTVFEVVDENLRAVGEVSETAVESSVPSESVEKLVKKGDFWLKKYKNGKN